MSTDDDLAEVPEVAEAWLTVRVAGGTLLDVPLDMLADLAVLSGGVLPILGPPDTSLPAGLTVRVVTREAREARE